jgi:hypothetical protein
MDGIEAVLAKGRAERARGSFVTRHAHAPGRSCHLAWRVYQSGGPPPRSVETTRMDVYQRA